MPKCPVCKTASEYCICPECGFDTSRHYEAFPTVSPVSGTAISAQRKAWLAARPEPAESKKKPWWFIAVAAILVVVIVVGVIALPFNKSIDAAVPTTAHVHTWIPANCTAPQTCALCGATEGTPTTQHQWKPDDNDATSSCMTCGLSGWASAFTDRTLTIEEAAQFKGRVSLLETRLAAVRNDGTVYYAGDTDSYVNPLEIERWSDIVKVSVVNASVHAVKSDGTTCWTGFRNMDPQENVVQLGDWWIIYRDGSIKLRESLISDISAIDCCLDVYMPVFRYVLCSDGTVRRYISSNNEFTQSSVEWIDQLTNVVGIAYAGSYGLICLRGDGTLTGNPEKGFTETEMAKWTNIVSISAHNDWIVGLKSDGTAVAFGDNDCNQCDVSNWTDLVGVYTGVFGANCTVGLRADGTLVSTIPHFKEAIESWQNITSIDCHSSNQGLVITGVSASGKAYITGMSNADATSNSISNAKNVILFTLFGDRMYLNYIGNDGWVYNVNGTRLTSFVDKVALGDGLAYLLQDGRIVLEQVDSYWSNVFTDKYGTDLLLVRGESDIVKLASYGSNLYALKQDGSVITISGENTDWTDITDLFCTNKHVFAITTTGTIQSTENGPWQKWTDICAGDATRSARTGLTVVGIRKDGTVLASGSNTFGQCDVFDWKDIVSVAVASTCTLGLKSDGTVVIAGLNGLDDVALW